MPFHTLTNPLEHLARWRHISLSVLAYAITILPATALLYPSFWTEAGIEGILLAGTVFVILQDAVWFATCGPREYYHYLHHHHHLLPLLFRLLHSNNNNNNNDNHHHHHHSKNNNNNNNNNNNKNAPDIPPPRLDWITTMTMAAHAGLFLIQLCLLAFPARLLANLVLPGGADSPHAGKVAGLIHCLGVFVGLEVLCCNVMLGRDMEGNGGSGGSGAGGGGGSPKAKKKNKKNKRNKEKQQQKVQAEHEEVEAEALVKGTLDRLGGSLPEGWSRVPCDVWVAPKA
ncbi:uncharacterized protein B0T15DRAFT_493332 [Chaetomium strumarium]|uniref:Uncharacterized protein n=1 Tax=Chaetomium strumarium TaxID=1170767 RepID=A0AAJ0GS54_9PEZI|nr:hypothetical protein B0T15DRAFT_493332 [Chaetomium strumarium]